ncbi:GtrA family protein [Dialister pneumosintes]|uniref:GtrA family protein n=1 Tax=Dialister pneumosintes TaxID=39950 RepID=A0A1B3WFE8_9FIRM|nr:sugar translocase [Dialister pneumosintes]RID95035.1 GtrA family protein [Dialister pneumosintes]
MNRLLSNFTDKERIEEVIRFLIVGGGCFLLEYILLYVLTEYMHIGYLVSSAIAFTVSLLVNYILCLLVVFNVKHQSSLEIGLFIITSLIGLIINQGVMWFLVEIIAWWYMFAKVIASGIVMIWNYITKRYILIRK